MPPPSDSERKIIHIDMDAFYASVEQRDRPELRGRPVAVGSPDRRGVVLTASYEARVFGVHSAMPSAIAQRRCPNLLFVPPRFPVYRRISTEIRQIFFRATDLVEPLSLDEAYLDVTRNKPGVRSATRLARMIRDEIRETLSLTASAGISYNKFLAKTASSLHKPDGQTVILPRDGPVFIARLPIDKFHGIGPATARKMHALGVRTGADLREKPLAFLQEHFGKTGWKYYQIARGVDPRPVEPDRPRKSIGCEDTFREDISDWPPAAAEVTELAERVVRHLENRMMAARTVTLKVKYADFRIITRSHTLPGATRSPATVRDVALALLRGVFPPPIGIRLLGVTLSGLADEDGDALPRQLSLWRESG